jgi:ATP-dependent DNA ligase
MMAGRALGTGLLPMEARLVEELPRGPEWIYEPKWDGFRCLAFRRGRRVELQSKSGRPLARYFPELVDALLAVRATRFVLDSEIAIELDGRFSFDALLMRLHPAASRVERLARETPAIVIVFDLLEDEDGRRLDGLPLSERRVALERFFHARLSKSPVFRLSPATRDAAAAARWLRSRDPDLDGVVAKRADLPYQAGERTGMQKVKRLKTADCIVGGFRYLRGTKLVGSLLLGLYDAAGKLDHVGFTSQIADDEREALTRKLERLVAPPGFTGKSPGGPSRWNAGKDAAFVPLRPRLVVEVVYDQVTNGRFRHGTRLLRFRPDKDPKACTLDQIVGRRRPSRNPRAASSARTA